MIKRKIKSEPRNMKSSEERRLKVAEYLVDHQGEWVPGYELASPEIGGSEGLRRVRELYDLFDIRKRKMPGSDAYEYKLVRSK